MKLFGSWVAIITPFDDNYNVDYGTLKKLIDFQIENGTDGILLLGTTGEGPAIGHDEKVKIIEEGIKHINGRVKIMVGTGTNNTDKTIEMTKIARDKGADFALVITPYYNKPNQEGLFLHFAKVAESVDMDIVVYNVPGRTGVAIKSDTLLRLTEFQNIVGVKEASGKVDNASEIIKTTKGKLDIISGDDTLTLPLMSVGCTGVISVTANIVPKDVSKMVHFALEGKFKEAKNLHYRLFNLSKAMFLETNPIPVKTASGMMGLTNGKIRLPLGPLSSGNGEKLKKAMVEFGIEL
ncbi:MAG: 4-hydroxy-tetrahydrodipicolinate synthase [Proteobacteria bacterium]|nr:4-hydroxy-tetrahydrodipicolinate synthase [Pseudomonadota bacterium]